MTTLPVLIATWSSLPISTTLRRWKNYL